MRKLVMTLFAFVLVAVPLSYMTAQQPERQSQDSGKRAEKDYSDSSIVSRMMAFNKKKDGKLTKEELTDARLHRLFDLADTNKDGVVTREELMAAAAKLDAEWGQGQGNDKGGKGKGPGGPKGKGGPDDKGPRGKGPAGSDDKGPAGPRDRGPGGPEDKGPGGPRGKGPGGPPVPGQILSPFLQTQLNLTDSQKQQLIQLQSEVDTKLGKILTDDQKQQLRQMRERGPGAR